MSHRISIPLLLLSILPLLSATAHPLEVHPLPLTGEERAPGGTPAEDARSSLGEAPSLTQENGLASSYQPTAENRAARREFEGFRFGIFLHWGIYAEFAQGEWYLNNGLDKDEYAKAASCFYPIRFDAKAWVKAIKDSGAKYITFTSRHHDSFSMWHTAETPYNIVDATPFHRDVLKELSDACQQEGIRLHLYYSILDWIRADYPLGRTGLRTGRTPAPNYDTYFRFMKNQVRELLTQYGPIGAVWLDGYWDHDSDSIPFDWRMPEFYRYIHSINPACLIGNNHHIAPIEGEDFQMFERDLPGENTAGLSGQDISALPLEMCQTMNGMWGYKVADQNYKSTDALITLIVRAAAKGTNLLLNIGPQPNGELPATALDRLQGIGRWMRQYGQSIYNTQRGRDDLPWGVTTIQAPYNPLVGDKSSKQSTSTPRRGAAGGTTFAHVLDTTTTTITLPMAKKPRRVTDFITHQPLPFAYNKKKAELSIHLSGMAPALDRVVRVE